MPDQKEQVKQYFLIEEGFANAVLDYLTTRPFREVFVYVQGFQALPKAPSAVSPLELVDKTKK